MIGGETPIQPKRSANPLVATFGLSAGIALVIWPIVIGFGLFTGSRGPLWRGTEYFLLRGGELEPINQNLAFFWAGTETIALVAIGLAVGLGVLLFILEGGESPFSVLSKQGGFPAGVFDWCRLACFVECQLVVIGLIIVLLVR